MCRALRSAIAERRAAIRRLLDACDGPACGIGADLREMHRRVVDEPMPSIFTELLDRLGNENGAVAGGETAPSGSLRGGIASGRTTSRGIAGSTMGAKQ